MRYFSGPLLIALVAGCSTQRAAVSPASDTHSVAALPFIEDDYPRALAEARARRVPIFVETWAPW